MECVRNHKFEEYLFRLRVKDVIFKTVPGNQLLNLKVAYKPTCGQNMCPLVCLFAIIFCLFGCLSFALMITTRLMNKLIICYLYNFLVLDLLNSYSVTYKLNSITKQKIYGTKFWQNTRRYFKQTKEKVLTSPSWIWTKIVHEQCV